MAMVNCSECGKPVSTSAAACPHCGAPRATRSSTSPWKVIGWIALVLALIPFLGCVAALLLPGFLKGYTDYQDRAAGRAPSPAITAPAPVPAPTVKVQTFECRRSAGGMAFVEGVVVNTSSKPLPYVELQVTFRDKADKVLSRGNGYADTHPLAPGQSSTFKALGEDVAYHSCQIEQANASGEALTLQF